ncbi:SpoIIE family protein phosphatase [Yinghuangia sp. ASG 101]|uniref:ATP-binding SpoIIE family protein phosphatase n=1 Tax=Yinghuangia sp. ASG 101 TaxID=2896848 RepID=UPI001E3DC638|nr:SpoIIE family protein phosphatase [Yinghuangia sp. ASG 101]UGQ12337.1 SpoIIE family protein phosphatase [Yinghuangia sp. ASG 101]
MRSSDPADSADAAVGDTIDSEQTFVRNGGLVLVLDGRQVVVSGTPDPGRLLGRRMDLYLGTALDDPYTVRTGTTVIHSPAGRHEPVRYSAQPLTPRGEGDAAWLVRLTRAGLEPPARGRGNTPHARLSHAAAMSVGASLEMTDIATGLARLLVPDFADVASVDIPEEVLDTEEPPPATRSMRRLRRVAVITPDGRTPPHYHGAGKRLPPFPDPPQLHAMGDNPVVRVSGRAELAGALGLTPDETPTLIPEGAHSLLIAPLFVSGRLLGVLAAWRTTTAAQFDEDDADLLAEIASRGALALDNARRYAREHHTTVALQRSLLPPVTTDTPAATTAGTYVPARGDAGVGGDWYDVLPLSSLRAGFVVGDVVGHGLRAAVAMGRLRTAVQSIADRDLDPGEMLAHLDDLVLGRWIDRDTGDVYPDVAAQGATVLYAVYDPVLHRCAVASAGHPPPLVLRPGEEPEFMELTPGPPLGVGGLPFETVEVDMPPDTLLALYTDGLVERRDDDISTAMTELATVMRRHRHESLDTIGSEVLRALQPPDGDDVALLLARVRAVSAESVAEWNLPGDPSIVRRARELTHHQLGCWGLDELAHTTELVVSELVTNAIRYGGSPVELRLIYRDDTLICEVSDPSNSQPRMRRATVNDEGGRGLFLVAQLTQRWGSRYRSTGKTIWTEQNVSTAPALQSVVLTGVFDTDTL